jgi:hypothetical protein
MHQYRLWVRISPTTTSHTIITADSDDEAVKIGEAKFGTGNVLFFARMHP